ncbi:probable LRR receptor-like serine/threonine-protein kinase At5g59680 isoform X2 [Ananas comosus]|uniref:non-specific serine/threonine protein kinase n=1 Tax=Ananas comosus TaxID=4615 RepID=A0A6P5FZE9_ANACO|nr:probable LRR receptor-like serine/threonine-protein kinase At5g59680 isoform X2 [Ananas comosus]
MWYPDDAHDRIWIPWSNAPFWTELSTNSTVQNIADDHFEAPSAVLQTAAVPVNSSALELYWDSADAGATSPNAAAAAPPQFFAVLHFSELQLLPANAARQFNIFLNGKLWYGLPFTPEYLYSDAVYGTNPTAGYRRYNVSINATANSTLPPLLNALEVFYAMRVADLATDAADVAAITAVKQMYQVKRNWMGDPCAPKSFAWDGLNCSYAISSPPRITTLNLESSGLNGEIATSLASLKALQYLDLSHNNLTGSIPDALSELPSLVFLDLTYNQLNGSIPAGLLKKSQDGSLTLRVGNNLNLCNNGDSCVLTKSKKSTPTAVIVIVPIVVVVLLVAVILVMCRIRKQRGLATGTSVKPQNEENYSRRENNNDDHSLQFENRQFMYKELEIITNYFEREIGRGGFGKVYDGFLENGTQVAVKMRSQSSHQGVKEFLCEAQHLTRVHHKNLVSLIGYCKDGDYLGLVYEYMAEGTLQEHLRGRTSGARPLTWGQRLRIALESAQGLEYLHKGCKPPLIHRDVKTNNILLTANLEAKIADFGLSRAFNNDTSTSESTPTAVVGTPGYIDPEYHNTFHPSEKTDVYSFGVVLLEVITGQSPILPGSDGVHIVQWVRQRLARGNIEGVVDSRMRGEYDINSVWKVADVALKCTAQSSSQRPLMPEVVMQLKESLELEEASGRSHNFYSGSINPYSRSENIYTEVSDVSQNSAFEVENVVEVSASGPAAR